MLKMGWEQGGNMSDTSSFQIVYAGPALETNEMDVRNLAPALVAVADLLEEANLIVNGGGSRISVNVQGSFKSGSFAIDFKVIHDIYQNVMALLNSAEMTGASNLLSLVGLKEAGKGLVSLLQKLRNRKIQKVENVNGSIVRIHITRAETIEVDSRVIDLYKSPRVRSALEKVIAEPLGRSGVDEVRTKLADGNGVTVKKDEKQYFDMPLLEDEILGETVTEAYLQVVSLSFKEDNKWRFSRGETVFYALIEDIEFLEKIDKNEERFSKDDILKVQLYTRYILTDGGFRTEYRVQKVLDHRSAARQLRLPIDADTKDGNPEKKNRESPG
jgi:hypothetical protein